MGKEGGIAVKEKYGIGHMRDIGRRGGLTPSATRGRPRALTIEDIISHSTNSSGESVKTNNYKEGSPALASRYTLLELWKRRRGSFLCPAFADNREDGDGK